MSTWPPPDPHRSAVPAGATPLPFAPPTRRHVLWPLAAALATLLAAWSLLGGAEDQTSNDRGVADPAAIAPADPGAPGPVILPTDPTLAPQSLPPVPELPVPAPPERGEPKAPAVTTGAEPATTTIPVPESAPSTSTTAASTPAGGAPDPATTVDPAPVTSAPPPVCWSVDALPVTFESDRWDLDDTDRAALAEVAAAALPPSGLVAIDGYTDERESPLGNDELSRRRAQSVLEALVELGVDRERLQASGHGATNVLDDTGTPEAHAKNRRVELHVAC